LDVVRGIKAGDRKSRRKLSAIQDSLMKKIRDLDAPLIF
jgi:hypothetical protein